MLLMGANIAELLYFEVFFNLPNANEDAKKANKKPWKN